MIETKRGVLSQTQLVLSRYGVATLVMFVAVASLVQGQVGPPNSWVGVSSMANPRAGLGAALGRDGRIYAIGGEDGSQVLDVAEAYEASTGSWNPVKPMPTKRHSLAVSWGPDGKIYALGGTVATGSATNSVEAYDPVTDSWLVFAAAYALSSPRTELAAVTAYGKILCNRRPIHTV